MPNLQQFLVSREFGGAGDLALHIARDWQAERAGGVEAWLPGEGRAADEVRKHSLPTRWYDLDGALAKSSMRNAKSNLGLAARLAMGPRGIRHIHSPAVYGSLCRAFHWAPGKTVVHVHLDFDVESLRWALRRPPELIVTCARFMEARVREALPEGFRAKQRVAVVPNAVDTERFRPADKAAMKARLGAPLDCPLVLMLANLAPHKGQLTAIRAVAELRRQGVAVSCWLAGVDRTCGDPFESQLKQLIDELDLDDCVKLLGQRSDAPELLGAADLLLLPSTSEGLPLTILEAQASQTPVLAAPTAGIPEVIRDGETGYLIAADDFYGYATRIAALMTKPAERAQVARAAYEQCLSLHGWSTYYRQMRALYEELLESPLPSSSVAARASLTSAATTIPRAPTLNGVPCNESLV